MSRAQGSPSDSVVVLEPGDLIRITVWRQTELSGEFVIARDGSITHPLYRDIKGAGVPLTTVEERIRSFLTRFETNPHFVVSALIKVVVGGEVRQPNIYNVPPGSTVAQVIALAGGPTDRGRLDRVQVLRGSTAYILDLTKPDVAITREQVRSGDRILLARRRNLFQEVLAPGASILGAMAALASVAIQLSK